MAAVGFCLLYMTGCGDDGRPEVYPAHGQLRVNQKPATGALITLHPLDGKDFDQLGSRPWAKVDEKGNYVLTTYEQGDGAPAGDYRASILWLQNPDSIPPGPDLLGGKFSRPEDSELTISIAAGENEIRSIQIETPLKKVSQSSRRYQGNDPIE